MPWRSRKYCVSCTFPPSNTTRRCPLRASNLSLSNSDPATHTFPTTIQTSHPVPRTLQRSPCPSPIRTAGSRRGWPQSRGPMCSSVRASSALARQLPAGCRGADKARPSHSACTSPHCLRTSQQSLLLQTAHLVHPRWCLSTAASAFFW